MGQYPSCEFRVGVWIEAYVIANHRRFCFSTTNALRVATSVFDGKDWTESADHSPRDQISFLRALSAFSLPQRDSPWCFYAHKGAVIIKNALNILSRLEKMLGMRKIRAKLVVRDD